jgi:hypothetical protein
LTEAKSRTDFSYYAGSGAISKYIPNSSVTVSGGNVTIKLDKPKDEYLVDVSEWLEDGITVSDNSAKTFGFDGFNTQDRKYYLICENADGRKYTGLGYVTKNVTITGSYTDHDYTVNYNNVSLKAGWNYMICTESGTESTYTTASQSLPSDMNWTVKQ